MSEEKTFTQDEVNAIVSRRLGEEKARFDAAFAEKEQELAKREFRLKAVQVLKEKNLPVELLEAINCTDEASLEASLAALDKQFHFSNPNMAYVQQPDGSMRPADGGADVLPPTGRVDKGAEGRLERKAFGLE